MNWTAVFVVSVLVLAEYSLWYRRAKRVHGSWFLVRRLLRRRPTAVTRPHEEVTR